MFLRFDCDEASLIVVRDDDLGRKEAVRRKGMRCGEEIACHLSRRAMLCETESIQLASTPD